MKAVSQKYTYDNKVRSLFKDFEDSVHFCVTLFLVCSCRVIWFTERASFKQGVEWELLVKWVLAVLEFTQDDFH